MNLNRVNNIYFVTMMSVNASYAYLILCFHIYQYMFMFAFILCIRSDSTFMFIISTVIIISWTLYDSCLWILVDTFTSIRLLNIFEGRCYLISANKVIADFSKQSMSLKARIDWMFTVIVVSTDIAVRELKVAALAFNAYLYYD